MVLIEAQEDQLYFLICGLVLFVFYDLIQFLEMLACVIGFVHEDDVHFEGVLAVAVATLFAGVTPETLEAHELALSLLGVRFPVDSAKRVLVLVGFCMVRRIPLSSIKLKRRMVTMGYLWASTSSRASLRNTESKERYCLVY